MFQLQVCDAFFYAVKDHATRDDWAMKKEEAGIRNGWFAPEYVEQALNQWVQALQPEHATAWVQNYKWPEKPVEKTLGLILAGNIPVVGFHDILCGLSCGYQLRVKLSSDDEVLLKFWFDEACKYMPELANRLGFSENMKGIDVAIATGSNNSSRYFEYYFRHIPHLLRKNRNSAAILTGTESEAELQSIGRDVFDYFGLGCRNVTHLRLPEGYAFKLLFDAWQIYAGHINHHKYAGNYEYHKAILLMNLDPHLDNGFLLMKEKPEIYSPVGMLNYSYYNDSQENVDWMQQHAEELQCVVGIAEMEGVIRPGKAQQPGLSDYADGKDVVAWLLSLQHTT
ncbi:MAG: acyl-CoA reductase [Bacteroidetes bacterium]|nr:acyl-CoA reductase [Bacteroidota bacterium]